MTCAEEFFEEEWEDDADSDVPEIEDDDDFPCGVEDDDTIQGYGCGDMDDNL